MSKGSAMGLWTGKKGSTVFYKITNSNNKEVQGEREYQPNVRNPQTNAQADQRMKMLPAQLIAGALREIISRSFQGVQYGAKSRLAFRRYALLDAGQIPYVPKGTTQAWPGEYLISKGTLPEVKCVVEISYPAIFTTIKLSGQIGSTTTIGQLSADIIANNPEWERGDQLTVVGCLASGGGRGLVNSDTSSWYYYSFILDLEDTTTLNTLPLYKKIGINDDTDGVYGHTLVLGGENDNLISAAIIHSRKGEDGLYLRSNARLCIYDEMPFYNSTSRVETRASYQTKTRGGSSDWPVDPDWPGSVEDGLGMLRGLTGNLAQLNGTEFKLQRYEYSGEIAGIYYLPSSDGLDKILITPEGEKITYTVETLVYELRLNQVPGLDAYPAVLYSRTGSRLEATRPATAADPGDIGSGTSTTKKTTMRKKSDA